MYNHCIYPGGYQGYVSNGFPIPFGQFTNLPWELQRNILIQYARGEANLLKALGKIQLVSKEWRDFVQQILIPLLSATDEQIAEATAHIKHFGRVPTAGNIYKLLTARSMSPVKLTTGDTVRFGPLDFPGINGPFFWWVRNYGQIPVYANVIMGGEGFLEPEFIKVDPGTTYHSRLYRGFNRFVRPSLSLVCGTSDYTTPMQGCQAYGEVRQFDL